MAYSLIAEEIIDKINIMMKDFSHTKKDLGYGWRWTFENGMRFDIIDYKKKWQNILRVGRGARLVKQNPILDWYFDVVSKVIAKILIVDANALESRWIRWLLELLHQAPKWIGVLD